jgi:2'-5' RNA ligase
VRLFFAVDLPEDVRAGLARLVPPSDPDYRAVDPTGMHVTLAFLGDQPSDRVDTLTRIGTAAAAVSHSGTLALGEAGAFGPRRAPRVLWVGLRGDVDRLNALQSHLSAALVQAALPVEDRAFSPHITLARRRQNARGGAPHGWPPAFASTHFALRTLTLFESRLSPRGATYLPVAQLDLGG